MRASYIVKILTYILLQIFKGLIPLSFDLKALGSEEVAFGASCAGEGDGEAEVVYCLSEGMDAGEEQTSDVEVAPIVVLGALYAFVYAVQCVFPFLHVALK